MTAGLGASVWDGLVFGACVANTLGSAPATVSSPTAVADVAGSAGNAAAEDAEVSRGGRNAPASGGGAADVTEPLTIAGKSGTSKDIMGCDAAEAPNPPGPGLDRVVPAVWADGVVALPARQACQAGVKGAWVAQVVSAGRAAPVATSALAACAALTTSLPKAIAWAGNGMATTAQSGLRETWLVGWLRCVSDAEPCAMMKWGGPALVRVSTGPVGGWGPVAGAAA